MLSLYVDASPVQIHIDLLPTWDSCHYIYCHDNSMCSHTLTPTHSVPWKVLWRNKWHLRNSPFSCVAMFTVGQQKKVTAVTFFRCSIVMLDAHVSPQWASSMAWWGNSMVSYFYLSQCVAWLTPWLNPVYSEQVLSKYSSNVLFYLAR